MVQLFCENLHQLEKIPARLDGIRTHQMTGSPASQITQSDFRLFVTGMAAVWASLLLAGP